MPINIKLDILIINSKLHDNLLHQKNEEPQREGSGKSEKFREASRRFEEV